MNIELQAKHSKNNPEQAEQQFYSNPAGRRVGRDAHKIAVRDQNEKEMQIATGKLGRNGIRASRQGLPAQHEKQILRCGSAAGGVSMRIVLNGGRFFTAGLAGCRTGAAAHAAATMGAAVVRGRALSIKSRQHVHAAGNGEQGHQQHAAKRARQPAMNVAGAKHG